MSVVAKENVDQSNNSESHVTQNSVPDHDGAYQKALSYVSPGYDMLKAGYMSHLDKLEIKEDMKEDMLKFHEKQFEIIWHQFVAAIACDSRVGTSDKSDPNYEELSDPTNFRFTIKPINARYQIFWDLYQFQVNAYWRASEIDFEQDRKDFEKVLSDDERTFVKMMLSFFAAADGIVNLNIGDNILNMVQPTEARCAYGFQYMMENVHGEVYSDMLTNVVADKKERTELMNGFKNVESIIKMKDWACKWIDDPRASLAQLVVAFTIVEGVFFSGAFAAIYWLKNKHRGNAIMNGLMKSNKYIARDEGVHTNFGCAMYYFVNNKLPEKEVYRMFDEAIELTSEFARDAIRVDLIGMNDGLMTEYNQHIADRLLTYLGYGKRYHSENPFEFMKKIGILNKANFFEVRPDDYQSATNEDNTNNWKPGQDSDSDSDSSDSDSDSDSSNSDSDSDSDSDSHDSVSDNEDRLESTETDINNEDEENN